MGSNVKYMTRTRHNDAKNEHVVYCSRKMYWVLSQFMMWIIANK